MSGIGDPLRDTVEGLFAELADGAHIARVEGGDWPARAWKRLAADGWPLASVPEEQGGAGMEGEELAFLLHASGYHHLPLPFAETLLARRLLAECALQAPPATEALSLAFETTAGVAARVPFARHVPFLLLVRQEPEGTTLSLFESRLLRIEPGSNLAGEPRDRVWFADRSPMHRALLPPRHPSPLARLAFARAAQMSGAAQRAFELALEHARTRTQFGRIIGRFQAVRHMLAQIAEETGAAATAVAAAAVRPDDETRLMIAKIRTGEAAGRVARLAHAILAATGYTREHPLQLSTRRLWSWREEAGDEGFWAQRLGEIACRHADRLWEWITESDSRLEKTDA